MEKQQYRNLLHFKSKDTVVSKISKYSHFRLRFSLYYLEKKNRKNIIASLICFFGYVQVEDRGIKQTKIEAGRLDKVPTFFPLTKKVISSLVREGIMKVKICNKWGEFTVHRSREASLGEIWSATVHDGGKFGDKILKTKVKEKCLILFRSIARTITLFTSNCRWSCSLKVNRVNSRNRNTRSGIK